MTREEILREAARALSKDIWSLHRSQRLLFSETPGTDSISHLILRHMAPLLEGGELEPCKTCRGRGSIRNPPRTEMFKSGFEIGEDADPAKPCPDCGEEEKPCGRCGGDEVVTVCDKCLKEDCWHGEFMCDEARHAGTVEKPCPDCADEKGGGDG